MEFCEYSEEVQQWIQQVIANREINAELTLKYSNQLIEYAERTDDCRLRGIGYYYCGETYYGLNDGTCFFDAMGKALSDLNQAGEWELMVRCYNFMGIAALNRGNIPIALDYYLNGLNYCKEYQLKDVSILLYINLGMLYIECERFEDAEKSLGKAYNCMQTMPEHNSYYTYMFCICTNQVKCLLLQDKLEEAAAILEQVHTQIWEYGDDLDKLPICCAEVLYYHRRGMEQHRNEMIAKVRQLMPEQLNVLDFFYDLETYCNVLLDAQQDDAFWQIVDTLEPLVGNFNIINLQLRIISLKIRYYHMHGCSAEYLQAAGLYYELSEMMKMETRNMVNNVIKLRKNLEKADRARARAEAENIVLQERSLQDPLTKMANRYGLNEYSEEVFTLAEEQGESLAVEILDVDYFKELNDNYGHQAGDRCLVKIAQTISKLAGENNAFAARYGGDEFVIIYYGISREKTNELAKELKKRIVDLALEHRFSKALPIVTISQGLCWGIPQRGCRMWDFLHTADEMLYRAKEVSRNNYCVCDVEKSDVLMGE